MILRHLAIAFLALCVIAVPVQAAKAGKGRKGAKSGRILNRFDRDHNGAIDGAEVAHVQAAYAGLAALDTDKNGELSESELAAAKIPTGKGAKKKSQ
jgi:Ca2+-binding EF-hand superfamily protein